MSNSPDPWETLRIWFPDLDEDTWSKLNQFCDLLREWNAKINLISRKDTDRLEIKHLAHCLTITKFLRLMPKARVLDVGTGGGLPGIPL
ncbi:MAG: 16S rRNA (guanine(527)-N(7))-methyltransferase RsmG, partial [Opitutae bacterium]|nr:16S rRNA (guanine(527)-N(7))-methyltransferase RsmG [Opitutae bacterium]